MDRKTLSKKEVEKPTSIKDKNGIKTKIHLQSILDRDNNTPTMEAEEI